MAQQLVAPTRIAGADQEDSAGRRAAAGGSRCKCRWRITAWFRARCSVARSKAKVAPHVVAISAGVADGMIIRKTPPVYPKFAQDAHITGKVVLKAMITKQGTIEGVQVLSGPKILAPSAVDAVRTWKYKPYMLDNQPVVGGDEHHDGVRCRRQIGSANDRDSSVL